MSARIRTAVALPIGASPDQVYAELLRIGGYNDWWPKQVRFESTEGVLVPGGRFKMRALGGVFELEVVRLETDKGLWFRFVSGPYAGTGEWVLEPTGSGTKLVYQLRVEPVSKFYDLLSRVVNFGRLHAVWAEDAMVALAGRLNS